MDQNVSRIVEAVEGLKRALLDAGIDAPFAVEFDDPGAGYALMVMLMRGMPTFQDSRYGRRAPQVAGERLQGEVTGVPVRWPGARAYAGAVSAAE